ncbi:MAG: hypothetical protein L0Z50_25470 [Verrucomicrobiales bacterium]|nr:hypothetical protein [Verrucomicrobiales bacterium]
MNSKPLRKIAFVVEEFSARGPAQQLLDRFLMGYPHDGEFRRLDNCRIVLAGSEIGNSDAVKSRVQDYGLSVAKAPPEAVADADAVVAVWRGSGAQANPALLETVLQAMPPGARCFVHGALANTFSAARKLVAMALARSITLRSGTSTAVTYRLPELDLPIGSRVREALIVVQGAALDAELDALEGLFPVLARRRNGEAGVKDVRFLQREALWEASRTGQWSWPLLAAALSRSNTVQGDPIKDGRTQDVAGLGLVPTLAKDPRGWLLEHRDGIRSTILVLDGVVADFNFAVHLSDGSILSAQLYRPPAPMQDQFSRLAAVLEQFFRSGEAPWPGERSLVIASVLEALAKPEARTEGRIEILLRP